MVYEVDMIAWEPPAEVIGAGLLVEQQIPQ
jgi:hypothetical protein